MFYYSKGTQIYCAPTVDARPVWQNTMTHIALEGRCFVLSACQYAQEKDYPADHAVRDANARNGENVMIAGGSVIIDPLGNVLAGPLLDGEGVLSADLELVSKSCHPFLYLFLTCVFTFRTIFCGASLISTSSAITTGRIVSGASI